jgi:glycosyltransferase involved in cell wall biosynthesis
VRRGLPTVFVQDTDIVLKQRQLSSGFKAAIYIRAFERMCRWGVARADLCLLKGSSLMRRYGGDARNAHEFHDTSYSVSQIVPAEILEQRLATLGSSRPIRLVYCGRLISRKGIDRSLKILAASKAANIQFDIIGEGPELKSLQALAAELRISVQFPGSMPYDDELLKRLAGYDALLFTPASEDTPRMIFDGYACGLPLIAFDIDYVRERHDQEHATVLLPRENTKKSGEILTALGRDPRPLAGLARAARAAADFHAAENWYRRRAEWTFQAVAAHTKSRS